MKKDITSILANADVVLNQKTEQKLAEAVDAILAEFQNELQRRSHAAMELQLKKVGDQEKNQSAEIQKASRTFQTNSKAALMRLETLAQSVSEKSESAQKRLDAVKVETAATLETFKKAKSDQSRKMRHGTVLMAGMIIGAIVTILISTLLLISKKQQIATPEVKLVEQRAQIETLAKTYGMRPAIINGQPLLLLDKGLRLKRKSFVDRNNTTTNAWEVVGK